MTVNGIFKLSTMLEVTFILWGEQEPLRIMLKSIHSTFWNPASFKISSKQTRRGRGSLAVDGYVILYSYNVDFKKKSFGISAAVAAIRGSSRSRSLNNAVIARSHASHAFIYILNTIHIFTLHFSNIVLLFGSVQTMWAEPFLGINVVCWTQFM